MLTAKTLTGNWCTLLLPINQDNRIDYLRLEEELNILIKFKVDGIYSNGTTGEFYNQTESEFDKINYLLAEKCHAFNMAFQIGVSHPSPIISLERLRRSVAMRPDAFQVILPDWITVNKNERFKFLEKMADTAEGLPLVLYNPPNAKSVLEPVDFAELSSAFPQLIGLKVAPTGHNWYAKMRHSNSDLSIFVPGHWLATGFKEGVASGSYSNIACLSPKGAQWWWNMMKDDIGISLEIEERIHHFFSLSIEPFKKMGYSDPALDKFLAAVGNWAPIGTRLRWPYNCIPEVEISHVRKIAHEKLPEFFA